MKTHFLQDIIDRSFVVSPAGKVIKYKPSKEELESEELDWVSMHSGIAFQLTGNKEQASDILFNKGYLFVGGVRGVYIKYAPTQAQINYLFDRGFRHITDSTGQRHEF